MERLSSPAEVGLLWMKRSIGQLEGIPGRPASGAILDTRTLVSRGGRRRGRDEP